MNFSSENGISLYYALLIMSVALAIALGLNTLVIKSMRTSREIKKSPAALYAADTGIEKALYEAGITGNWNIGYESPQPVQLEDSKATYSVRILGPTTTPCSDFDASRYCIRSVGKYRGSTRILRVIR